MADPTGIFHPSWNITCEIDVFDSTYSSDFISNVFPQVTLSQMDKTSTEELTKRRQSEIVQSMAYNVGFDRRYKTELEEARGLAVVASTESSEYKTKYELTKKNQQEEHDRLVCQVSNLELEVSNQHANDSELNGRLTQSKNDMDWMLQEGIFKSFDKAMCSETFVSNSKILYKAYNDYGIDQGCKLKKEKYGFQIQEHEMSSERPEELQHALAAFCNEDYVASYGLDRSSFKAFKASLVEEEE
ncbi:unnamed protein product [Lactuca virosa]|uniref:Uncharacterized protein n=1 Tax=Lactuca virosa TaxID=75947 RepID=A0AAU9LJF9_9ASTR|nr:unnamed protein product [Lactuca virosa]